MPWIKPNFKPLLIGFALILFAAPLASKAATVPSAPVLDIMPGNAEITLSWTAPYDGGSPITNYRIYRGTASNGETFLKEIGNVLTYKDTGLTNGQTYFYKVSAKNAIGEGAKSNEKGRTPLPNPMVINPDKTVSINGQKVFPVAIYGMCRKEWISYFGSCNPSKNWEFMFDMTAQFGTTPEYYDSVFKEYEKNGKGFAVTSLGLNIGDSRIKNSDYWYLIRQKTSVGTAVDEPNYYWCTQPNVCPQRDQIIAAWNNAKTNFPEKPVYMNNWRNFFEWLPYVDIYAMDSYVNRKSKVKSFYSRDDMIYANENVVAGPFLMNGKSWNDPRLNNKTVWTVLETVAGTDPAGFFPMTKQEARTMTWGSIAYGTQGISFWGYEVTSGTTTECSYYPTYYPTCGLAINPTMRQWYGDIANEIKSLNSILILPTKAIHWANQKDPDVSVTLSDGTIAKKNICTGTEAPNCGGYGSWSERFTYILKQSGSIYYLIVVNKDKTDISNIKIKVGGLTGTQTVKTLGSETTGSGRAGRTLSATNGEFTDYFDGYAVHIYQLTPGSLPAHCIDGTKNYDETDTDCGGADCGACFVPPSPTSSPSPISSSTPLPTATPTPATPYPSGAPITPPPPPPSAYVPPWEYGEFPNPLSFGSIYNLIGSITGWILGFVASIILLMMIIGGLIYTTSAGDEERMAWAKKIVIAALIGFVVIILSATLIEELKKIL